MGLFFLVTFAQSLQKHQSDLCRVLGQSMVLSGSGLVSELFTTRGKGFTCVAPMSLNRLCPAFQVFIDRQMTFLDDVGP